MAALLSSAETPVSGQCRAGLQVRLCNWFSTCEFACATASLITISRAEPGYTYAIELQGNRQLAMGDFNL